MQVRDLISESLRALQQLAPMSLPATVVQRDEWQLGCVISTLPDAVGIPPQSGSVRMSLSKFREALESPPTTSPTPSHMAHGCIPSTAVSTDCRPLYRQPSSRQRVVEALQLYSTLQHYSSTALYSIHPLQHPCSPHDLDGRGKGLSQISSDGDKASALY